MKLKDIDSLPTTRWCVLTGGPRCGKSTLLARLESMGYSTAPEVARRYIAKQLSKGRSLTEITHDQYSFQRAVIGRMQEVEKSLDPNTLVFLDRALPDGIAYYRAAGLDPKEVVSMCTFRTYRKIFVLASIPEHLAHNDPLRLENAEATRNLEVEIERAYTDLGYSLTRVPFLPVDDRAEFVLSAVAQK